MKTQARKRAFTLTELLVVMSVVIILMSMLVVGIDGVFTYAVRMQCQHHMEQTWQACMMYQNKNKILPFVWDIESNSPWYAKLYADKYVTDASVLGCPSSDLESEYGSGEMQVIDEVAASNPEAVESTLRWLAYTQDASGAWSQGAGSDGNNQTRTAITILAFIGAGVLDNHSEFGDTVTRGVEWLAANHSNGFAQKRNYTQGMFLMATSDSSNFMTNETLKATVRTTAQQALNYLLNQQPIDGGYTYDSGGHDMSVSGWCYQGMAQAVKAGLVFSVKTNPTDLERIYGQPPGPGALVGWMVRVVLDDGSSRYTDNVTSGYIGNLSGNPQRLTQAAFGARLLLGPPDNATRVKWEQFNYYQAYYMLDNSRTNRSAGFTVKANPNDYSHIQYILGGDQLYALYYSTVALFLAGDKPAWDTGGASINYWSEFKAAYIPVLLDEGATPHGKGIIRCATTGCHPITDGKPMSHWPITADSSWGGAFGVTVTTALAALSLGVDVGQSTPGSKWFKVNAGKHSFGYNREISDLLNGRRTPASDTIILMDYTRSAISIIGQSPDTIDLVAARHGGKVNVLFGDGHVEALTIDELRDPDDETRLDPRRLSVQPGAEVRKEEEEAP